MLVSIILTILGVLFCRYLLPMIILSIAGAISRNDEMTNANKQNITAARSNGYQFSALHIIERILIYVDMVCVFVCLFFTKICLPFALALFVILFIQVFECVFALKNGSAYTWIYVSMFGRRGNQSSGGMYTNNMYGNVNRRGLFGRNNQGYNNGYNGYNSGYNGYNNGYNQPYNNQNGYGYNNQMPYGQQNNSMFNRQNRNQNNGLLNGQAGEIGINGKRPADGNIQGWPVWSVNGSKKCFITEKGMIIYKLNKMSSLTGKNISDDTSCLIYEFVGESVEEICKTIPKVSPVLMVNKNGSITNRLYVTDSGRVCESAFENIKYPPIKELENGIAIKNPETDYYVAERYTKSNVVLSTITVTEEGYEFITLNDNKQLEKYKLNKEFEVLTVNGKSIHDEPKEKKEDDVEVVGASGEDDESESVSIITGLKEAVSNLPSKSSLKVTVQNLAKVKLAGFGNDGVYNDGTVDVMCEFGELMIIDEKSGTPWIQAIVLSKLIPAMNVDDIMRRIGDWWTDSNLGGMIDDACITIMQQIEAKESQCLNYWLTDDKDVYYLSFVFNGNESADSALSYKIYNLCKRMFLKVNITVDDNVGYRCSMYSADTKKFVKEGEDVDGQKYFNINPINTTPELFNKYLARVENGAEQFKRVSMFTGLSFKARVLGCMSYQGGNRFGYCCKTYLNKSFIFDWERNKSITKTKVKSSVTTPAKLRDILNSTINDKFYDKYAPIFAISYDSEDDVAETNFLFGTSEYSKDELYNALFNTPLVTYACYDRLDNYLLDSSRDKNVYIILFKKKES